MTSARTLARRGFSLIELVIVIVIIGIIAAIAIPRMSRGAEGANDSALKANLAVLRSAIDLYHTEHEGLYPTEANIVAQLTTYTDSAGAAQATADTTHIYGPYLSVVPPLPVNTPRKGGNLIAAADAANVGWIYDVSADGRSYTIKANTTTETDVKGVLYTAY
ncbi:MAG TPA: prepilin-type N-terminal cleavage/methylation domain-containing protein [Phycisphaerales bacterium]|nr:prepilin-type N-terminal cleavage/methylation domain-containing protein [Phycisphaerales bacterium]